MLMSAWKGSDGTLRKCDCDGQTCQWHVHKQKAKKKMYVRRTDGVKEGPQFRLRYQPGFKSLNHSLIVQSYKRKLRALKVSSPTREQLYDAGSSKEAKLITISTKCMRNLTARISSSWLLLVTVTPLALFPFPNTEF